MEMKLFFNIKIQGLAAAIATAKVGTGVFLCNCTTPPFIAESLFNKNISGCILFEPGVLFVRDK